MSDPFAALVEELNLTSPNDENTPSETQNIDNVKKSNVPNLPINNTELPKQTVPVKVAQPVPTHIENESNLKEKEKEEEEEEASEDEEETFSESIKNISDIEQLRNEFIAFYKSKESEIYELKNKFTEISRRQKEVFMEVENRRKLAASKGKKYKQTAQKYHYQTQKMSKDLEFERSKSKKLKDELTVSREQKKKIIEEMNRVRSQVSTSSQIMDQTHNVIDKLIQNEKIQETLKCFIKVDGKEDGKKGNYSNMTVAKLEFIDDSLDVNSISIQWNRSYFTQLLPIKNANKREYQLSADDIGSVIKAEVRSKDNPDCYETATLKNGPISMHKQCADVVQENLLKVNKQQIEFEVEPDLSDANTAKLISSNSKNVKGKVLILHFNKDKIKLRTPKNSTIEKEQYNDSMKIILSAMNPKRFSFKLSSSKKYVFLAKSCLDRDNIAIFLRCYIERLQRNESFLCEYYLRLSNERRNNEILNRDQMGGIITLTRDQLVSKILAPISSNPGYIGSFKSNPSIDKIPRMLAPISNGAEPSLTNDESAQYDVDEIFPDFNNNKDDEENEEKNEKKEEAQSHDIQFEDEDEPDLEAQNAHKKAWKSLQFVDDASIATEQELKQNALVPAPMSKTKTKKSAKSKKKKKKKKKSQNVKEEAKEDLVKLSAEICDRLDCLLNAKGDIIKHQVVGSLTLKYDKFESLSDDKHFYGMISNLEHTKTKIFNPLSTETLDKNGAICVKLEKHKDGEGDVPKQVGVLKYVWITDDIKARLPFLVGLKREYDEDGSVLSVCCVVERNEEHKNESGSIKEMSITGTFKEDVLECTEHSELDNVDFIWSKDISKKFIWSIKCHQIDKKYELMSRFKSSTSDNKVQLKVQFEIENIGISEIQINAAADNPQNNGSIVQTFRNIKSGEFLLRETE